jgi:hypothetical protein
MFMRPCNWLQALENEIDTTHQTFLHFGAEDPAAQPEGTMRRWSLEQRAARYKVVDTDFGTMYGAHRPAGSGRTYWRVGQYLFPFYVHGPIGLMGGMRITRAWVPMDDHHVMCFTMADAMPGFVKARWQSGGKPTEFLPNTSDWFGRFRIAANEENDYFIDRADNNYSNVEGLTVQDEMITAGMGSIVDRSQEHLGTSDMMIIRTRRRILKAIEDFQKHEIAPPGVDSPGVYATRSGGVVLNEDEDWLDATKVLREAYRVHEDLDYSVLGGLV